LILYLFFRQVDPSVNNAPGSLPENIQQRNIRRVKVNAQVAFAIYILETLGIFSMMFFWLVFKNTDIARTAFILLYYVLLPYIYLLNTSNNKDRITDEGWWSTVQNALGMSNNNCTKRHSQTQQETFNMQTHRTRTKHSVKNDSSIERTNARLDHVNGIRKKSDIYTVSYNTKETETSESDTQRFILEVNECSSSGITKPSRKHHEVNHLNLQDSDDDNDDAWRPHRSRYLHLAEKILFEMMMNIDKEEVYIYYLKQLLVLDKAAILDDFKVLEYNLLLCKMYFFTCQVIFTTRHLQ